MNKLNIVLLGVFLIAIISMFCFFDYSSKKQHTVNYPFFLSTKYSTTNIRSGPGEDFPVIGVFQERHIPIKVIASYKEWYQIQDYSGKIGWLYKNIVIKKQMAITKNKSKIYLKGDENSKIIAIIDKDIVVALLKTKDKYAQISFIEGKIRLKGWTLKNNLWGL